MSGSLGTFGLPRLSVAPWRLWLYTGVLFQFLAVGSGRKSKGCTRCYTLFGNPFTYYILVKGAAGMRRDQSLKTVQSAAQR